MPGDVWTQRLNAVTRVVVTLLLLSFGFYVLLNGQYPDATTKAAFTFLGAVVGYWTR